MSIEDSKTNTEINRFLPQTLPKSEPQYDPTWRDTLPQIMASIIVYGIVIQAGINMAYSTVLLGGLESNDTDITISKSESSWIASLVTITTPIGSLISGPLMDTFGRKIICLATCCPIILSWILLTLSNSVITIYCARIIAGWAAGLTTVSLVYVMEITHPRVRGMLLCFNSVFVALGILLTCFFALFFSWRNIGIIFIIVNVLIFITILAIPESPHWLLYFSKKSEAKRTLQADQSLKWLNRTPRMYEEENARIQEIGLSRGQGRKKMDTCSLDTWKKLAKPEVYRPICLLLVILLVQQLSGCYVVIFYALSVFRKLYGDFGNGLNEYEVLIFLGVIRFSTSLLTAYLSRKIGRRVLCMISGIGMSVSMIFSSIYLYILAFCDKDSAVVISMASYKWILLVLVLLYVCLSSLGFVVIPWTLIGELLPISFRGIGGGLMVSFAYVIMFGVVKSYPSVAESFGDENLFLFFGLMSSVATAIVYFFLPETLGKSLLEIEEYFIR